jgi:hypothetical protein
MHPRSPHVLLVASLCVPRFAFANPLVKPPTTAVEHDIAVVRAAAAQPPAPPSPTAASPAECPAPEPPPAASTVSFGVTLGVGTVNRSPYAQRVSQWGYGGFNAGPSVAVEGGVHVGPWILFGLRGGLLHSESDTRSDGGAVALDLYDFGLIGRAEFPLGRGNVRGAFGVQVEGGLQFVTVSLRGVDELITAPRAAFLMIGKLLVGRFGFELRAGQRFAAALSRPDFDPGGLEFATGFEVRL